MADNTDQKRQNTNRLVKIAALREGWTAIVARIIEFSNYIGYLTNILVINMLTGKVNDRSRFRNLGRMYGETKHRDCKNCYNRD